MGYRTLIVDDEPAASDRLLRMLSQINAPCDIIGNASNGYDALMMINRSKPDIVFLDIELPGIKGIEARHVHASKHHLHNRIDTIKML
jgi:two-component system LytT family response regulator